MGGLKIQNRYFQGFQVMDQPLRQKKKQKNKFLGKKLFFSWNDLLTIS